MKQFIWFLLAISLAQHQSNKAENHQLEKEKPKGISINN